jgi:hypothetical protein
VPEPESQPEPDPKPRRGRPPGSRNAQKAPSKRQIPWFNIWRAAYWAVVACVGLVAFFRGVEGWLGSNAAYVVLAASLPLVAFLLDRDWNKMRGGR